jgi:DNA-binding transcriptional ArsR family regulator
LATDVFKAVADPTRRTLLDRLRDGGRPAGALAGEFSVSRPAISRQLRILRQARLVVERREGRRRIYELAPRPLDDIDAWLAEYRELLRGSLQRLKAHVDAGERGRPGGDAVD